VIHAVARLCCVGLFSLWPDINEMTFDLGISLLICLDTICFKFIGQGRRSRFEVTGWKCSFLAMDAHYRWRMYSETPEGSNRRAHNTKFKRHNYSIVCRVVCDKVVREDLLVVIITRTLPVEAALIPVTTPSQPPVCSVNTHTCTAQRLLLAGWPRPLPPRPPSPASRPARHQHCLCHRQPCGFNNSTRSVQPVAPVDVAPTAAAKPACIEPAAGNRLADTVAFVDHAQPAQIRRPLPSPTPLQSL